MVSASFFSFPTVLRYVFLRKEAVLRLVVILSSLVIKSLTRFVFSFSKFDSLKIRKDFEINLKIRDEKYCLPAATCNPGNASANRTIVAAYIPNKIKLDFYLKTIN